MLQPILAPLAQEKADLAEENELEARGYMEWAAKKERAGENALLAMELRALLIQAAGALAEVADDSIDFVVAEENGHECASALRRELANEALKRLEPRARILGIEIPSGWEA